MHAPILKCLLIDDEARCITLLRDELDSEIPNLKIQFASTGRSAVEQLEAEPFDVIICDYLLPDIPGTILYDMIRSGKMRKPAGASTFSSLPFFIFLTAAPFQVRRFLEQRQDTSAHILAKGESERLIKLLRDIRMQQAKLEAHA